MKTFVLGCSNGIYYQELVHLFPFIVYLYPLLILAGRTGQNRGQIEFFILLAPVKNTTRFIWILPIIIPYLRTLNCHDALDNMLYIPSKFRFIKTFDAMLMQI